MHVWNVLHAARWKYRSKNYAKNRHIAQLCRAISSQLRHVSTIGTNLLSGNTSSICFHNMANFGPLTAEICWRVWGSPTKFWNVFRVLASLLHRRRWTEVNQLCTMFGRLLHWYTTYTFLGLLSHGILPAAKFTLRPRLAFYYIGSITARHSSSSVSQSLRRSTRNGITGLSQGGHQVGHRPTFWFNL